MAIVVKNKKTQNNYILLGTGFGAFNASKPNYFFENLLPYEQKGTISMVAVCDEEGNISWIDSNELQVVQVDGISISDMDTFNK
jgi:hypothetical protein